jgi:hypothetical protein
VREDGLVVGRRAYVAQHAVEASKKGPGSVRLIFGLKYDADPLPIIKSADQVVEVVDDVEEVRVGAGVKEPALQAFQERARQDSNL